MLGWLGEGVDWFDGGIRLLLVSGTDVLILQAKDEGSLKQQIDKPSGKSRPNLSKRRFISKYRNKGVQRIR